MRPLICATVTGRTTEALLAGREEAAEADLVEFRLDTTERPDVRAAIDGRRHPVIVTCRAHWEGGHFPGSEEERERLLAEALDAGAEWVDVEWRAAFRDRLIARAPGRVIVSCHDFARAPSTLESKVAAMQATGAAVAKVAVMVDRLADLGALAALGGRFGRDGRLVFVAMGAAGVVSRLLPARFGSRWTYAGAGVAPGQIPLRRMREVFRVHQATAATRVYGIVGRPLGHSLSPAMHNAALAAAGLDAMYVPLEAADFDDFEEFADDFGVEGCSVTAPFKREACAAAKPADALTPLLGAANTLRRTASGWEARNTDVDGFLAALDRAALRGGRGVVLGAGGAARAVVAALRDVGMHVSVHARRGEAAAALAAELDVAHGAWPPAGSWDLLVNTTPVGTWPEVDESPLAILPDGGATVYDLVYNPPETRLLREARQKGCRTIGGLAMLVAQAEQQFGWWTGVSPADGVMRAAAEAALAE